MNFSFTPPSSSETPGVSPVSMSSSQADVPKPTLAPMGEPARGSYNNTPNAKSLLTRILTLIFGVLLLITVGLFIYQWYLQAQIESKKQALATFESQLASVPLQDIRKLSARLKAANQLIKDHPFANVMFKVIEDSVENNIIFSKFTIQNDLTAVAYIGTLEGVAPDYKSIVQQIETFRREPYSQYMSQIQVKNLRPDSSGKVSFAVTFNAAIRGILPEEVIFREEISTPETVPQNGGAFGTSTNPQGSFGNPSTQ